MFCKYCGKEIDDDSIYCGYCGKRVKGEENNTQEEKYTLVSIEDTKKEEQEQIEKEKLQKFKKSYSRAGFACLIWVLSMSVLCSALMVIGYIIVAVIYINQGGAIDNISISNYAAILSELMQQEYFIVVPICYTLGYIISALLSVLIGRKLIYKKEDNPEVSKKNIAKLSAKQLLLVIAACFGVWGIGIVIGNLPEFFGVDSGINSTEMIFGKYDLFYILLAMIGAPFIEEFMFRKLLLDKISHHGEGLAVLISGFLFGFMHGNLGQFFFAFMLGIIFAIVYIKTRNILYTMGLHFMINTFASIPEILMLFGVDINAIWTIITIVLCVVGLIITIICRKNEIFKISTNTAVKGTKIYRAVGYLILFIVLAESFATATITSFVHYLTDDFVIHKFFVINLALVPLGLFIVFMILFHKQLKNKFVPAPEPLEQEAIVEDALSLEQEEIKEEPKEALEEKQE